MKDSIRGHEKAVEALKAKNALGDVPETVSLPTEVPEEVRERVQRNVQQELEAEKAEQVKVNSAALIDEYVIGDKERALFDLEPLPKTEAEIRRIKHKDEKSK